MATPIPNLNPSPGEPIRWTIGPYVPDRQKANPHVVMLEIYQRQKEVIAAHATAGPRPFRNFRERVTPLPHGPGNRRLWDRFWRKWNQAYMHLRDSLVEWVKLEVRFGWYMPHVHLLWECLMQWGVLVFTGAF
jgi:hypothetical protein